MLAFLLSILLASLVQVYASEEKMQASLPFLQLHLCWSQRMAGDFGCLAALLMILDVQRVRLAQKLTFGYPFHMCITCHAHFKQKKDCASRKLSEQVYRGRLRSTGEEVAVKVQRPNISENIAIDMLLLRRFMTLIDARLPSLIDVSHCSLKVSAQ